MQALMVFVDYDNVESTFTRAGPVNLGKMLVGIIPASILAKYQGVTVRLYGGWRSQGTLTTSAQRLIPIIRADSPCIVNSTLAGTTLPIRLIVELAEKPLGTALPLEETLVKDRGLRKFRARTTPWPQCTNMSSCGLGNITGLTHASLCGNAGCSTKLGDILVRDEQKMVDTLIVADIASQVFVSKATDIVVVTSDTDMWPGILLALRTGCHVLQIHTKRDWRTQRHLLNTISSPLNRFYQQTSI